jgi:hypothetical protein
MIRLLGILVLTGSVLLSAARAAGPSDEELSKRPISTDGGDIGKLLRFWWKAGRAAGNVGDWYDNRDRGHSDLDTKPFPQLQRIVYTPEEMKQRRDWALATITRPQVVFGNSSTSAPPTLGGSNVRNYYSTPRGVPFLYQHYTHSNLYIYPEHRDHDPGHNGNHDGFGDLYPTNTPFLITSQGSSGSDQPFMRAIPLTLAAFHPEVKKKLVEKGLLMPTVQMILRRSNRHLANPKEYRTGKAHPSVFEGTWVDALKMVQLAHAINLSDIPPMVQLKVVEEESPILGRDFFEPGASEKLADTPAVIARFWRGQERTRRLVVSAEDSYDLNKRPLTYEWVLLRGDPARVTIKPLNKKGSKAEIVVAYHERRPIAPGSAMESNRVDIGVFVDNGAYPSAPGFITFFSFDSEARTYDRAGHIREIGYGMGEVRYDIRDWQRLFETAGSDTLAARLLGLKRAERDSFLRAGREHGKLAAALKEAEDRRKAAQDAKTKDNAAIQKAQKQVEAASRALTDFLNKKRPELGASLRERVEQSLRHAAANPSFTLDHAADLAALLKKAKPGHRRSVAEVRKQLIAFGVAKEDGNTLKLTPLQPGQWTTYEKARLESYHASLMAFLVYPGMITVSYQPNYVDARLTTPKHWRDVYHYNAGGRLRGWTRYHSDRVEEFNADGLLVLEKDRQGRCIKGRTVRYTQKPGERFRPNGNLLEQVAGDEIVTYEYDGKDSDRGRVKQREKVKK